MPKLLHNLFVVPWQKYYKRWVTLTISKPWAVAGVMVAILRFAIPLVIVPVLRKYFPDWQVDTMNLAWEIPFWIFVGLCLIRIVMAPYWIDQEREQAEVKLREELTREREQLVERNRQPDIVYDHCGETLIKHGDGESYKYTHLWFRNRPAGRPAHDVAARITVWSGDGPIRKLFSSEGKWMGVPHDQGPGIHQINTMNLLPNDASHGLDLFIRLRGAPDCYVVFADSTYRGFRRNKYRIPPSYYYVKVTLACERYTHDFRFSVRNNEQDQSVEVEQVTDDVFSWE